MSDDPRNQRRKFLLAVTGTGGGMVLATGLGGPLSLLAAEEEEEGVPATEDLMREHGVLDRTLLVYEEIIRRLEGRRELKPEVLAGAADIVRQFIEDYHEKDEETYLFPHFEKAGRLVDLVHTLRTQHQAGRNVTKKIRQLSTLSAFRDPGQRNELISSMHAFIRMYRPHAAHEDTLLFPAFRRIVSQHEFEDIGQEMERKEHTLFGGDGFEMYVDKVAGIERELGIHRLAQFTPHA